MKKIRDDFAAVLEFNQEQILIGMVTLDLQGRILLANRLLRFFLQESVGAAQNFYPKRM